MTNDLLALRGAPPRLSDAHPDDRTPILRQRHDAHKAAWLATHKRPPAMGARIVRAVLAAVGKATQ